VRRVVFKRTSASQREGRLTAGPFISVVRGRCLVQHSPDFALFLLGQRLTSRHLRLEQRPEKDAIILFGALTAKIPVVRLTPDVLGLEYLGFPVTALLAQHDPSIRCGTPST
jgi:hypothetical protein